MKTYLDNIKDFNDEDVEDDVNEYIHYHNKTNSILLNMPLIIYVI